MEVTTTTADWEKALEGVADLEDVIPGVGTLVAPEQAERARAAGAAFAVSPGYDGAIADACLKADLPYFPGIATPTELMAAWRHPAVAALKLFPAGVLGGVKFMKALAGPFPEARFIPTGGVSAENARDYLDAGALAVGMSAICKGDWIAKGDWSRITTETRKLMTIVKG